MPATSARNLTLTTVDNSVTVKVTYNALFSPFERHVASQGVRFLERIAIIGADPDGSTTGAVLKNFPAQVMPVTAGAGTQNLARVREIKVSRALLQEDPGLGDSDSIRCRISITPEGMPKAVKAFTDEEVLLG